MAEQIPGARFMELPGADHLPFVGDQAPILDEIEEFLTGVRHRGDLDTVLATVMFTDIVGSSALAAEHGDRRWRELLEAHHALVRQELERFRGREAHTAGDGFLATFDGPARAIRCASAIVTGVRRLGLQIRAGVHTGECQLIDGEVQGIAVHTGDRIAALAGPGEVLVSSTVKDLVAGSGIAFQDRGLHTLKGIPGEWRLFRVVDQTEPVLASSREDGAEGERRPGPLSRREREVATLVALGLSNRQLAEELVIAETTAERHVANILNKLGYHSRAQIAAWAVEQGMLRGYSVQH
jgi:class 3 adenylate cyclase/DNA-binding CsgD family transcriptional regulator